MSSPIQEVLALLKGVRETGKGRWWAICPAHEDQRPSLSIREGDDGRVLLKCFAGCGALDVLDALGLDWHALFVNSDLQPSQPGDRPRKRRLASPIPASDALELLDHEALTVQLIAHDLSKGEPVDAYREDLDLAAARIQAILAAWRLAP